MLIGEHGGDPMMANGAMMQALHRAGRLSKKPKIDNIHRIHRLKNKRLTVINFAQRQLSNFDQVSSPPLKEGLMHTKDILAGELRKAGLPLMAKMASEGAYSAGLSLHALPEMVLRRDLENADVDAGEFKATDDEIDEANARMVTSGMVVALAQTFNTPRP